MLYDEELESVHTISGIPHSHAQDWQIFPGLGPILRQNLSVLSHNSKSPLSGAEVLRKCHFHFGHHAGAGGDYSVLRQAHLASGDLQGRASRYRKSQTKGSKDSF